jgi:L-arabinose transport system substrate-binding protein
MKRIFSILMVAVLLLAMSACGKDSATTSGQTTAEATKPAETVEPSKTAETEATKDDAATRKIKIAYCAKNLSNQWQIHMKEALTQLQEEYNFELFVSDAVSNPETQIQHFENFITQGVDGIITLTADEGISPLLAKMCKEAGVAFVGEAIALTDENGKMVAPTVETNAFTFGHMCSEWIYENYKSLGFDFGDYSKVGFVTITNGAVQSMVNRCKAAEDKFLELFPDFPKKNVFVADVAGQSSVYEEAAYNAVSAYFTANPHIETWIVVAGGDDYGRGALRALEAAHLDEKALMVSMGGELAKDEWDSGLATCWYAACYFSALECAEMCLDGLTKMIREGVAPEDVFPEFKKEGQPYANAYFKAEMVTPENYRDIMWSYLLEKK